MNAFKLLEKVCRQRRLSVYADIFAGLSVNNTTGQNDTAARVVEVLAREQDKLFFDPDDYGFRSDEGCDFLDTMLDVAEREREMAVGMGDRDLSLFWHGLYWRFTHLLREPTGTDAERLLSVANSFFPRYESFDWDWELAEWQEARGKRQEAKERHTEGSKS